MTAAQTITPEERNKRIVRTYHRSLWGEGDTAVIDLYWSPEAEVHMTDFDGTAVDVVREDVERYFTAFTDQRTTIHHLVAEGDSVVLHWSTTGRHVGPYGGIAATGKQITMAGMDLLRLADGKIVECWSMWDGLAVYDQLGALKIG
ncbi:ester cyclase [Celeribacter indicus]|uniref:Ester cyclase n=1 Tax=Celeribacter indicus TaxID=1208324 RepID=A0A0B5E351_9RHOB|nr:ester cyclase [Celeribacter indicus]AJE46867.1 hypothetical protein P73_2152 [Celeribacter indicus]SDW79904.1 Predicted ester cyclase [Celeribacter indicus]